MTEIADTQAVRFLSEQEHRQWSEQGYLHIKHALRPEEVAMLRDGLLDLRQRFAANMADQEYWRDVFDAGNDRDLSIANGIRWLPDAGMLMDHPGVFGKILGVMGPYIQVLGSEFFFRFADQSPLVQFHTDEGPALRTVTSAGDRAVQIKAQFFLTDVAEPDSANFTIAPGSHRRHFPGKIGFTEVRNSIQILANAGDVVLFPLTLGHGVAPNRHGRTRVSVILRYGQIFCRPVDHWSKPEEKLLARLTPRQRRLLGDLGPHGRPGDVYGSMPGHLHLIFGDEWSAAEEARGMLEEFERNQHKYEEF